MKRDNSSLELQAELPHFSFREDLVASRELLSATVLVTMQPTEYSQNSFGHLHLKEAIPKYVTP